MGGRRSRREMSRETGLTGGRGLKEKEGDGVRGEIEREREREREEG